MRTIGGVSQWVTRLIVAILLAAFAYFVYNFYVCHAKKQEMYDELDEDDETDLEISKRPTK